MRFNFGANNLKTNLLTIAAAVFVLSSCGINGGQPEVHGMGFRKHLVVLVYDISASVDRMAILNMRHLELLYDTLGANAGGRVYGIHIKQNSRTQEPALGLVPVLEQLHLKGNAFQRANRRMRNQQLLAQFREQMPDFLRCLGKLIIPKKEPFSDVEGGLLLAKEITEMSAYRTWVKHVLLISDMENDLPPFNGIDPMVPVPFNKGVDFLVVRPSKRIDLIRIFSGKSYSVCATIEDAVHTMCQRHD